MWFSISSPWQSNWLFIGKRWRQCCYILRTQPTLWSIYRKVRLQLYESILQRDDWIRILPVNPWQSSLCMDVRSWAIWGKGGGQSRLCTVVQREFCWLSEGGWGRYSVDGPTLSNLPDTWEIITSTSSSDKVSEKRIRIIIGGFRAWGIWWLALGKNYPTRLVAISSSFIT